MRNEVRGNHALFPQIQMATWRQSVFCCCFFFFFVFFLFFVLFCFGFFYELSMVHNSSVCVGVRAFRFVLLLKKLR